MVNDFLVLAITDDVDECCVIDNVRGRMTDWYRLDSDHREGPDASYTGHNMGIEEQSTAAVVDPGHDTNKEDDERECDEFFGEDEEGEGADSLAKMDARAQDARFHNLGFHEAFEQAKETRLQEGFEAGYKQAFERAQKLGKQLGDLSAQSVLCSGEEGERKGPLLTKVSTRIHDYLQDLNNPSHPSSVEELIGLSKDLEG